ncbi:MAG: hypothetical protein AAF805_08190, partial [Planctomycetota bacterium]
MLRKSLGLILAVCSLGSAAIAQPAAPDPAVGTWLGAVDVQVAKLRLGFTVTSDPAGRLAATLTSIDQGNAEIPVATIERTGDRLSLE